jgi:opacity protein-like surface antigen
MFASGRVAPAPRFGLRRRMHSAERAIRRSLLRIASGALGAALFTAATPALAGPPYVSDDPEPTDYKHWEIYVFAAGGGRQGETAAEAGLDFNYGAAPDLQLTAVLPLSYDRTTTTRVGTGDMELAAKLKFLHQRKGSWMPDVAFFPRVFLPTAGAGLGGGRLQLLLPLWAQKDFGPWALFGGGGYQINPGAGNRDYWLTGIGLTRAVTSKLTLGAEIYHHTPDAEGGKAFTGVNAGLSYRIKGPCSLLLSVGPGVQHRREEGRYAVYTALKLDL